MFYTRAWSLYDHQMAPAYSSPETEQKTRRVSQAVTQGEIPVFLACPDVDPMHSPKIGYSLCSQ